MSDSITCDQPFNESVEMRTVLLSVQVPTEAWFAAFVKGKPDHWDFRPTAIAQCAHVAEKALAREIYGREVKWVQSSGDDDGHFEPDGGGEHG